MILTLEMQVFDIWMTGKKKDDCDKVLKDNF